MKKGESHENDVHVMKMTPAVAAALVGKPVASLRLPYVFPPGTRLFLEEFYGASTGRVDLCAVIGRDGDRLVFSRNWCWHKGAPEAPGFPNLKVISSTYPVIDKDAI